MTTTVFPFIGCHDAHPSIVTAVPWSEGVFSFLSVLPVHWWGFGHGGGDAVNDWANMTGCVICQLKQCGCVGMAAQRMSRLVMLPVVRD